MKNLHVMTFISAVLLLGGILESCANNAVKDEGTTTNQEEVTERENIDSVTDEEDLSEQMCIPHLADTICIIDGKVYYCEFGGTMGSSMIFDTDKVWLETPALQVFPYSDTSSYSFYVCTPFKCLIVDFSDENSLAQLSSLTKVLPSFERNTQSFVTEDSIAWYDFEVDFPTSSVANAKAIRKWLVGKMVAANNDEVDGTIAAKVHNCMVGSNGVCEYTGDLMDNRQIAQFAADVYYAIIEADYGDMEEDFIPTGLYQELNMRVMICNDRFVTYQQCESSYCGGTHGGFTERLVSFDHVNNQEIDNSYLFNPGCEEELVDLLVEEAQKSPNYKENKPDIRAGVVNTGINRGYAFPESGLSEEGVVFSFQPYQIDCFAAGTYHFIIPYDKLKHLLTDRAKWCIGIK